MNRTVRSMSELLQYWGTLTHKTKPEKKKEKHPQNKRSCKILLTQKFFSPRTKYYIINAWQQETIATVAQQVTIARNWRRANSNSTILAALEQPPCLCVLLASQMLISFFESFSFWILVWKYESNTLDWIFFFFWVISIYEPSCRESAFENK